MILGETDDHGFRNQQRLLQPRRGDVDLGLLTKIGIGWNLVECDLDPAFLIDTIALRLDPGDASPQTHSRLRTQHDFRRLADLDLAGLAFIDIGEHPNRFRVDECEYGLSRGQSGPSSFERVVTMAS